MGLTDKVMSALGYQRKSAPDYGQFAGWKSSFDYGWRRFYHRDPDYRREVGNLDANSLVMCVVNYTGTRLPEAKPVVEKTGPDGKTNSDPLHPLAKLIRRPNRHFVWPNYCLALSLDWWTSGNVVFLKDRSLTQVEQLWFLPWYLVRPRWPNDGGNPEVPLVDENGEPNDPVLSHYQYSIPGKVPVLYPKKDIVHIKRGVNIGNLREGIGAFEPLITELYGDKAMAKFTATIMRNMGIQVPIISPKDKEVSITESDAAAMKEGWIRKTTGEAAGEPVILTEPIDVEKFGFNPTELDLSKLRLIPESRVAAVTGIPAATLQLMVGLMNGTSYASSQQARQQGYEEVVIPIQTAIAEEINWQLLPDFEKEGSAEFSFDTTTVRVLQEDRDALYKREADALRAGGITVNQFLQSIGKEPVNGGDIYYVPSLSTPMVLDVLIEKASALPQGPPVQPPDPASLAKFADMDRMFESLEAQMKEFSEIGETR